EIAEIPRSILRFIALTTFRYGVRSIAHFIDVIDSDAIYGTTLSHDKLNLPLVSEEALQNSSLKLHLLDQAKGFGIVNRWKELSADKHMVKITTHQLPFYLF